MHCPAHHATLHTFHKLIALNERLLDSAITSQQALHCCRDIREAIVQLRVIARQESVDGFQRVIDAILDEVIWREQREAEEASALTMNQHSEPAEEDEEAQLIKELARKFQDCCTIGADECWDAVIGGDQAKQALYETIICPRLYPSLFKARVLQAATAVLLYGPPGR